METFMALGFFLNPIFAVVFCVNLVIIIQKLFKDSKANIDKNAIWLTISFTYIVTILTWMWGYGN
ncbi:hypothetical protein AEA09_05855 [Lysinibacillus contaminans]|uniref:Uncharacterized protein n=1 Tax=Lysinibacillus contaminans TaxID=1293441 RepID=A0ABR5K060_9BACI|nr:hypothetical protein [Lysinibacillus contaminans]KOS68124.1 hypothetical protein AEA09_05855 [Lysinibacillus contaminans]